MSSTRKTPEHLKSAENLRGVAEAVVAEVAEGAGAEVAEAAEVALVAEGVSLVAEVALAAEVAEGAGAEAAGAEGVARSERQAARH
jgi:hypothetical protein